MATNESLLHWLLDSWSDDFLKNTYSQLFSFAKKPKCSIKYYLEKDESNYQLKLQTNFQICKT